MADWNCVRCGWANRDFSDECLSCGARREEGAAATLAPATQATERRSWDLAPPSTASAGPNLVLSDPLPSLPGQPPLALFSRTGLAGGLAVAALAAILASAIWYAVVSFSSYQIGFVAAAVGWVIGTGAVLGARGRGSIWLSAASVVLTILSLAVSEYLIAYHFVTQEIGFQLELLQPPDVMLSVVVDILATDPLTLVFWGFAVVAAAYVPFKAIKPDPNSAISSLPSADPVASP